MLKYNGLYVSDRIEHGSKLNYRNYLRFYEDGTVVAVPSTGTPKQIARWFNKDNPNISIGNYQFDLTKLKFTTHNVFEEETDSDKPQIIHIYVTYEGTVTDNILTLHSYSHFNSHQETRSYKFALLAE
jgi:hypothetical protein